MSDKELPSGVVDKDAWNIVLKLQKHPIIKNPTYETSEGETINLASLPHYIREKIKYLPEPEKQRIEQLKALYFKINNNLTVQKRKAYGKKQGRGSNNRGEEFDSILELKREELLEYFGRMFEVEEVLKIVNEEYGLPIKKGTLVNFKVKYAEEIKKRVDTHQLSFHNIRLGIKKSRLEELSELYNETKKMWKENPKREDLRILLQLLEQLRKEAEGDRLTIDGKVDINYEHNIQGHLMKEIFATTNLKEIILGRVAARTGVNPIKLIFALQKSYYKKLSNVLGDFNEEEAESADLPYPSQLNYDFERIGKNFLQRDLEIEEAVIIDERTTERTKDSDKGLSIKEKLKAKLKSKMTDINKFQNKLDAVKGK